MRLDARMCIFDDTVHPDVYKRLAGLFPTYMRNSVLIFDLPFEHPDMQMALDILEQSGTVPKEDVYPLQVSNIGLVIERTYDEIDLSSSEYLTPLGLYDVDTDVNSEGADELHFYNDLSEGNYDYLEATSNLIAVSDLVTDRIRALNMRGIELRPVLLRDNLGKIKQYWFLHSSVVMPPLSPSMVILNEHGKPFQNSSDTVRYIHDSRFLPGSAITNTEFHYRKEDMMGLDFDFAYTAETLFTLERNYPVVSQKFYQMAKSLNLPIDWKPVRIDQ